MSSKIYGYVALAAGALVVTSVSAATSLYSATKASDRKELKRRKKLDKEFDLMDKKIHGDSDIGDDSTDKLGGNSLHSSIQHSIHDIGEQKTKETLRLKRSKK